MSALIAALERRAQTCPQAIALRSGDKSLSYAALLDSLGQGISQLQSLRVEALGLFLDNGIDWVVYDLAAFASGIRTVPLPGFFSDAQILHAIADAELDTILFDRALPKGVCASGIALSGFNDSRLQGIRGVEDRRAGRPAGRSSRVAKTSYTSGTTGAPKGIELEREFIEQTAVSLCQAIGDLEIAAHLSVLPYATLLENIAGVYLPLMLGRCVYAESSIDVGLTAALGLDPVRFRTCFNRVRPGSLIVTPQLLERLCELSESAAINPDCLAFVAVGGARVAPTSLARARAAGIPAYEGYGLTEFASVATLNTPHKDRVGSVGKPLPGVTLVIAEDGEICLSRYPVANASTSRNGLIRSGDFGRIDDDGYLYIEGRKSNLVVLENGRNIAPEWIETELNASALIAQSFVYGAGETHLAALLSSAATDAQIDTEIDRINRQLPAYARLREWHRLDPPFSREQQTLTANGRLRRRQITQLLPDLLARKSRPAANADGNAHFSPQESISC